MPSKYTKAARGQECQIRIPGACNGDPATTVFAHLNGAGMGMKKPDIHGSFACSVCHDIVDGRLKSSFRRDQLRLMHFEGMERTQNLLIEMGLLKL